ncbi:MAG: LysE family transporter [Magnetococcales bacterium]|nr:LysE family transporter [Magnetococcales bacterium]
MSIELWLTYVMTLLVFFVTPGPSHLLMLSNSLSHGYKQARFTAWGDLTANTLQIIVAGSGMVGVVYASQEAFILLKWAGVAYLIYLAVLKWRSASPPSPALHKGFYYSTSRRLLFMQGFLTSAANPKAVVFFAALFPQFLTPGSDLFLQITLLGFTYIVMDGLFLLFYGRCADWFSHCMKQQTHALLSRLSALCLLATAGFLAVRGLEE